MASPGIRPGLARLALLLKEAGSPQGSFPAVHVAGTNGKGSTAAGIASILRASGYKTALYTSPHLVDFSERLAINGETVPFEVWLDCTERLESIVKNDCRFDCNRPTYFELVTAAAIMITSEAGVDAAVFETGMGGRLDATNILLDIAESVIVPIGMDHMEYLGDTIEKIAAEKFAIMRPGVPALFSGTALLNGQFLKAVDTAGAEGHLFWRENRISDSEYSLAGTKFTLKTAEGSIELRTPLAGTFQSENTALAAAAAKLLSRRFPMITDETVKTGIASTKWPGRMEVVSQSPIVLLDGGHNAHAAARLAETMETLLHGAPLNIVIAMMKDKDIGDTLALLKPLGAKFFCTEVPDNARSLKAEEMKRLADAANLNVCGCGTEPLSVLREAASDGAVTLCCGSLFLVGYLKERINGIRWF